MGGAPAGLYRLSILDPRLVGQGFARIWNGLTLEEDPVAVLVESLKRRGGSEAVIEEALTEAARKWSASGPDSIAYRPKSG